MSGEISKLYVTIGAKTDDFRKGMEDISGDLKKTGAIIAGIGAAITAVLVLAVKSAAEEEAGIERLRVAMGNVGLSYDDARESLEGWIDAQQQSTAYADDEQRMALSSLIILTKELTKAQELLTIAFDLARWKQIDLKTATDLVMKVYAGDMGLLKRYGIIVTEGATATEALAQIQEMAAGQAEAYGQTVAGQFELMKNNIGDFKEIIGTALLPIVNAILEKINAFIQWLKKLDPALVKIGVIALAVAGILALLGGGFLLLLGFMPTIAKGFAMLSSLSLPKMVAAIGALVKALWLWVAAQLAVLAAQPWMWAALATGLGLIAFGVWKASQYSKEATSDFGNTAKAADEANLSFRESQGILNNYNTQLNTATGSLTDLEDATLGAADAQGALAAGLAGTTASIVQSTDAARALAIVLGDIMAYARTFPGGMTMEQLAGFSGGYTMLYRTPEGDLLSREDYLDYLARKEQAERPFSPYPGYPGFKNGVALLEPALLYGQRSRRILGEVGEAGVEYIGPAKNLGMSIANTFHISQLVVREEADIHKIAMELNNLAKSEYRARGIGG